MELSHKQRRQRAANRCVGVVGLLVSGIVIATQGGSVRRAAVVVAVMVVVIGLVWALKRHYKRHLDTPRGRALQGSLRRPSVRSGLAVLAFPMAVGWMVGIGWAMNAPTGSWVVQALDNLHTGLLFTGFAFIVLAVVRGGDEPRCSKCQYLLEGAPAGGYDACPECGNDLRATGGIAKGHKAVLKPMIAVGIVLMLASFASLGRISRGSASHLPYLPTGSLIKEITTAPRGFTSNEWTELLTRTLTPQETETLFEGMLELREVKGYFAREAEGWLDKTALAGAVPADMIERYYEGMLSLWLAAPERVSRGGNQEFRFGFGGDFQGNIYVPANSVLQVFFVPESMTVDGKLADMRNDPRFPIPGISMNTTNQGDRGAPRDDISPAQNGPMARVAPSRYASDTIELRGTGWLYIAPYGTPRPTGGATTPAGAVWVRRVDVRKTVRIED